MISYMRLVMNYMSFVKEGYKKYRVTSPRSTPQEKEKSVNKLKAFLLRDYPRTVRTYIQ